MPTYTADVETASDVSALVDDLRLVCRWSEESSPGSWWAPELSVEHLAGLADHDLLEQICRALARDTPAAPPAGRKIFATISATLQDRLGSSVEDRVPDAAGTTIDDGGGHEVMVYCDTVALGCWDALLACRARLRQAGPARMSSLRLEDYTDA